MHRWARTAAVLWLMVGWTPPADAQPAGADRYWGQWRGPEATGVARHADPPLTWSETENVAWKVEVPGRGSASPIVWGGRVFLLTAVPVGDPVPAAPPEAGRRPTQPGARAGPRRPGPAATGEAPARVDAAGAAAGVRSRSAGTSSSSWRSTARPAPSRGRRVAREAVPHEGHQLPNGTYASGSAVTDGERLYAFFGSWGLYAYDLDGELLWEADLGTRFMRNAFGEGTTPALHGDTLVVTWDHIRRPVVRRRARRPHRRGAVAVEPRRDRHLGHPPHRRARGTHPGRHPGHEPGLQLRPRDRRDGLAEPRHHHERHPLARARRGHRLRHERLSRQQPAGHPPRRRAGRRRRHRRRRLAARPRHPLRALAPCSTTTRSTC